MIHFIFREMLDRRHKKFFILETGLLLFSAIFSVFPIVLIERITDLAITGIESNLRFIVMLGGIYIGVQILRALCVSVSTYQSGKVQAEITYNLQLQTFEHIKNVKLQSIKMGDSTNMSNTLVEDTQYIGENIVQSFNEFVTAFFMMILGLYYVGRINIYLAAIIIPLAVISAFTTKYLAEKSFENITAQRRETVKLWKTFEEGIKGFLPLRFHESIDKYFGKIVSQGQELKKVLVKQSRLESVSLGTTSLLFMLTIGLIMIVSAIFVVKGQITIGGMTAIMMYNSLLSDPLIQLQNVIKKIQKFKVSLNRVIQLLSFPKEEDKELGNIDEVQITDVSYEINGRMILKNTNLNIRSGSTYMLVGETGSGKSTLVNLITGIYQCATGKITYKYRGKEVNRYPRISYMLQDEYLFNDTIYNNILIGNQKASSQQVEELIKTCNLEHVVKSHPGNIGDNGSKLSGGERKRILIARTLLDEKVDIYVFDEMSAALDEDTFIELWKRVHEYLKNKIQIYIEHNTVISDEADLVFDLGKKQAT